ncbi:MAG: restriction endonuclease [Anaerolineales bacterium]|nr:restriction endonuclease [Anaerolineales bacterium]
MNEVIMPTYDGMMNPLLRALKELGGSGTINEIDAKVVEIMGLSDEVTEVLHNPEKGGQSEVEYRLAWTRTYLKNYGILENSSRGVWALTPAGRDTEAVDEKTVVKFVKDKQSKERGKTTSSEDEFEEISEETTWQDELMSALLEMDPSAFERLTQRLLRESGFTQVFVTGKSGDGGIDGKGIMRLGGLLSFHVLFQCKRYKESVSSGVIRDFRGALVGRADKGLLITTGRFTKDAIGEATRDGATPIDLIDGDQLVELLKNLSLGVKTELVTVEEVTIDKEWFLSI